MKVRLAKIDEKQFSTCLKHRLWGANNIALEKWELGDLLVLYIDKKLAAIAEIAGAAYMDNSIVWDNGLFYYRIPLKFKYLLDTTDRIPFEETLRGLLIEQWGANYGWGILNKAPLSKEAVNYIIEEFEKRPNSL